MEAARTVVTVAEEAAVIESIVRWLRTLPRPSVVGTNCTSSSDTLIVRPVRHSLIDGPSTDPIYELAEDLDQLALLSETDNQSLRDADSSSSRKSRHRTCTRLCIRCVVFPPGVVHELEHVLQHHVDHTGRNCRAVRKSVAFTCAGWAPGVIYAFYTLGKHKQPVSRSRPGRRKLLTRSLLVLSQTDLEPRDSIDEEIIEIFISDEASNSS